MPSSISRYLLEVFAAEHAEHNDLIDAVHELGRKLAACRFHRRTIDFLIELGIHLRGGLRKSQGAVDHLVHLGSAQVRGHHDDALRQIDAAIVAQSQRRLVENAQQQLPQGVRGLLDLVEQQDRELQLLGVPLVERFLRQQRMSLTMAEIARRRANQLGDLVRVLELRAVNLDASMGVTEKRLGHGFHHTRLAGAGRPQKQKISHRPTRRIQPGEKHLIDLGDLFHGRILADDLPPQSGLEIQCFAAATRGIQCCVQSSFHIIANSPI